ncbi:MAG: protoporphyrinogen oxidase, partial [Acidimicrobiales bacterium]
ADVSVGAVCRARLGDEVTDRLIDPLLGGINASDLDHLGLRAGAPLLAAALERSPSLIEGMRALRPTSGPTLGDSRPEPVFHSLRGGLARLVEALVDALRRFDGRVAITTGAAVADLAGLGPADAVIVTVPTFAAAPLLAPGSPAAAELLATVDYASVAQVTMELPAESVAVDLDAAGILVPRVDGTVITAATWFSSKWERYRRPGTVLIRMTSGRYGDDRSAAMDDTALIATLRRELDTVVPITGEPRATRVVRWPRALPQYGVGHGHLVQRIMDAVAADLDRVHLAGAAYTGIGIPACIEAARATARTVLDTGHRTG